ncbi:4-coumarate--CoA ligase 3 [Orobanche gracilis]
MLSVASVETQNPELTSSSLALPLDQTSETTHVFVSKLPTIPISNHLPLHTYCFQNLSLYSVAEAQKISRGVQTVQKISQRKRRDEVG